MKKSYLIKQGDTHILKSLAYFDDAEDDPDPVIYFETNWKEVKKFFIKEVKMLMGIR